MTGDAHIMSRMSDDIAGEEKVRAQPRTDYYVVVRNNWSYVLGPTNPLHSGPWRYRWEAQEYADELNAAHTDDNKAREP